jgi:hypothetical protein
MTTTEQTAERRAWMESFRAARNIAALFIAFIATTAFAGTGPYVDVAAGIADYSIEKNPNTFDSIKSTKESLGLSLGYNVSEYLGFEILYRDFGEVHAHTSYASHALTYVNSDYNVSVKGTGASVLVNWPSHEWKLGAKVGALSASSDASANLYGATVGVGGLLPCCTSSMQRNVHTTNGFVGVSLAHAIWSNFRVQLELARFLRIGDDFIGKNDVTAVMIGISFSPFQR